jgi:hypothetical protein
LDSTTNSAIPYSIDPAITLYQNSIPEQNTREKLLSYSLTRKSQKRYAMPILW